MVNLEKSTIEKVTIISTIYLLHSNISIKILMVECPTQQGAAMYNYVLHTFTNVLNF